MNTKSKKGMTIDVQPLRSADEIETFREAIAVSSSDRYRKRNLLLFTIGVNTGLRISDIVKLRIEDVKYKTEVVIREGKTRKPRKIFLNTIMADIADYLEDMPDEGWLFPSRKGDGHITTTQAYRILTKAADYIGRSDIGTHTLRKTFGYHFYKRTKDVATLMEIFNHDSQSTTKRYIGIRDDEIADSLKDFRL